MNVTSEDVEWTIAVSERLDNGRAQLQLRLQFSQGYRYGKRAGDRRKQAADQPHQQRVEQSHCKQRGRDAECERDLADVWKFIVEVDSR